MSDTKLPSGIDRLVGQRLRWRRRELRLTQEKLGELLNLTFQQVQKYEKGVNRISAGRLYEISGLLGVDISYFYDGAAGVEGGKVTAIVAETDPPARPPIMAADTVDLVAAFESIQDPAVRQSLLANVRATAKALHDGETDQN